jgi:hypothetical protein
LVVCTWLANPSPPPWHVRHLLKPIGQEGRLPRLGDQAEHEDLLRRAGVAVSSVEDISAAVARTWSVSSATRCACSSNSRYRRFVFRGDAHDRIFAITLFRMLLAYRTGAMCYAVLTANRLNGRPMPIVACVTFGFSAPGGLAGSDNALCLSGRRLQSGQKGGDTQPAHSVRRSRSSPSQHVPHPCCIPLAAARRHHAPGRQLRRDLVRALAICPQRLNRR